MEPRPLGPEESALIEATLTYLVVFAALVVDAAVALLLGWAILPSLLATGDVDVKVLRARRLLTPIGIIAALLTGVALWQALTLAGTVADRVFPRGGA
jgi:hypothetical protein